MKIKAFTILELVIVMIVTAIVVSISFVAYKIVNKQSFAFQNNVNMLEEHQLFHVAFKKDFNSAKSGNNLDNYIHFVSHDNRQITYIFGEEIIVRTINQHSDTFFIASSNLNVDLISDFGNVPSIRGLSFNSYLLSKEEVITYYFYTPKSKATDFNIDNVN